MLLWLSKCSVSILVTSSAPFLVPSNMEVFDALKQNIGLLLCYILFISFHFHLLNKNALYLQSVLFSLPFSSLTCWALATQFIILLKFCVYQISEAMLLPNSVTYRVIQNSSFPFWPSYLLKHCILVVFLLPWAWTVLFLFLSFCSNRFLSRMCSGISHSLRPNYMKLSTVIVAYIKHSSDHRIEALDYSLSYTILVCILLLFTK